MFRLDKKKNKYSNFWLPDIADDSEILEELHKNDNSYAEAMRLSSLRRSIANFVRIVTGKDIPVYYMSGNNSLTMSDGSGKGDVVIISADIHEDSLDSTVGLALHEGSHVILTSFRIFENLISHIPAETVEKSRGIKIDDDDTTDFIRSLLNWIEDRRIDYFMYSTAPGYRGYYKSLYDRYFNSIKVTEKLTSNKYRMEDIDSYFFRIINLTNPNGDLDALKGLRKISETIDINNINRLQSTKDSLSLALKVYNIMLDYVEDYVKPLPKEQKKESSGRGAGGSNNGKSPQSGDVIDGIQLTSGDEKPENESNDDTSKSDVEKTDDERKSDETPDGNTEKSPRNEELKNDEDLKNQKDFINGNIEKKSISPELQKKIETLQEAGSECKPVVYEDSYKKYNINVIVMRNITDNVFHSSSFPWSSNRYQYSTDVQRGITLGLMLGKKLKVRNEDRPTIYTRKDKGKVDKRLLAELGFQNEHIFQQTFVESYTDAILHISIDASGSMWGSRLGGTITVATAIAKAATMIEHLNVIISLRGTSNDDSVAIMAIIYDSRVDNFYKITKYFPRLKCNGVTPEGLCYAAIADEVVQSSRNIKSYFLNLCDGAPYFNQYSGMPAAIHTRKEIDKMRDKGVGIMAYYFGTSGQENDQFKTMFGRDGKFIDTSNILQIAKTLNELFLSDEQKQIKVI